MSRLESAQDVPTTRILLVDDNPDFLRVTADFVRRQPWIILVGATGGVEQALTQAPKLKPHVVLIDLEEPGLSALQTIPRLRDVLPGVRIVGLTLFDSRAYSHAALDAGAHAVVSKSRLLSDLLPAIRQLGPSSGWPLGAGRCSEEPHSRALTPP